MSTALFSAEQLAALSAPLDRAKVQTRSQAGRSLSYLEGWHAIAEANRIFGFDGWQRETVALRCISQAERTIGARGTGREQKPGWGVTYTCRVRITVGNDETGHVIREGCGAGHGIDVDLGQAHESALKEAETDAMKRALMTFGNPFGLALYDKAQRQVSSAAAPANAAPKHPHPQAEESAPTRQAPQSAPLDAGQIALDGETIQNLHSTLRALPRPLLENLTAAFRRRFQVPVAAVTIADRITLQCHHDWIEAFLVQHQGARPADGQG